MIQKLLSDIQIILMIFVKILKIIIQIKKQKILIIFDVMIVDMLTNTKLNPIVTELFILQHTILLWKFQTMKRQQIALNHSSDIDF